MEFKYLFTSDALGYIDVEDIGNVALEAITDDCLVFYLVIQTNLGLTSIFEYGPLKIDFNQLPKEMQCSYSRINFSRSKIIKRVNSFINKLYYKITQVNIIEKNIALDHCVSIIDYMRKL